MNIYIIAALAKKNRTIGKDNQLMWSIPEDLAHFKNLTTSNIVIMGRKTYESIGRPLPKRINIIVTRDKSYQVSNSSHCVVVHSVEDALNKAKDYSDKKVFIIGGGELYSQYMSKVDKLYLTLVDGEFEGDTFFPDYSDFKTVLSEQKSTSNGYKYTFVTLTR